MSNVDVLSKKKRNRFVSAADISEPVFAVAAGGMLTHNSCPRHRVSACLPAPTRLYDYCCTTPSSWRRFPDTGSSAVGSGISWKLMCVPGMIHKHAPCGRMRTERNSHTCSHEVYRSAAPPSATVVAGPTRGFYKGGQPIHNHTAHVRSHSQLFLKRADSHVALAPPPLLLLAAGTESSLCRCGWLLPVLVFLSFMLIGQ